MPLKRNPRRWLFLLLAISFLLCLMLTVLFHLHILGRDWTEVSPFVSASVFADQNPRKMLTFDLTEINDIRIGGRKIQIGKCGFGESEIGKSEIGRNKLEIKFLPFCPEIPPQLVGHVFLDKDPNMEMLHVENRIQSQ